MTTDTQPTARLRTAPRDDAPSLMLAAVCAVAVLNGISTIVVTYDGCGDEGQIHSIVLQGPADHDGTASELPVPEMPCTSWSVPFRGDAFEVDTTFAQAIDDLGLEMLAQKHNGWENGDGAFGELTAPARDLAIPEHHRLLVQRTGQLGLLASAQVSRQLHDWLA